MEKLITILLIASSLNAVFASRHEDCDKFYHTGTPKTLVRFYDSRNEGSSFEIKQSTIWEEVKEHFNDFADISFEEIDCFRCPESCFNFVNESLPSYTMVFGDLLMATCVRPVIAMKAKNFVYDYTPKRYKKKKNYSIATTHCDVIYPELVGTAINQDSFDASIKDGVNFVLFFTKWCHYCRMFYPLWERLISSFVGKPIKFYRVDCIAEKEFCTSQNAIGFPTVHLYVDGALMEEYQGSESINELKVFAEHHLKSYADKKLGQPHLKFYK
ncbi:hypothetical protein ACKWTF_012904 [Chironomus riparius]